MGGVRVAKYRKWWYLRYRMRRSDRRTLMVWLTVCGLVVYPLFRRKYLTKR